MGDYAIKAAFDADCSPGDVSRWLSTTEGIAGWWSDTVDGSASAKGDEFHVSFPTTDVVFDLVVSDLSDETVEWQVPESPPWWKGTTIRFDLSTGDSGGSSILFSHGGFDPDDPIVAVITPAWVRFLDNLVDVAQTGQANPAVVN